MDSLLAQFGRGLLSLCLCCPHDAALTRQKLVGVFFLLLFAAHWMSCVWGLLGHNVGAQLCDANSRKLEEFF